MLEISQRLLSEASQVDDFAVTPLAFRHSGCNETTHTVEWGTGVSSGSITVEVADREDYAGDWKVIETITYDGKPTDSRRIVGTYGAFKHRVDEPVTDGTATSKIRGSVS